MLNLLTIDNMQDYSVYTALGNDTVNLAGSAIRITGNYSLEFDKTDGAANKKYAGAYRSVDLNLTQNYIQVYDKLMWSAYLSALTNVDYSYIKLGTDSSNNHEWRYPDSSMAAGWNLCRVDVGAPTTTNGNGWNPASVKYMEVGIMFDAETNALADIKIDSVSLAPARFTRT